MPAPKPNLAPAPPRRAFPRAFPHLAGTANSHLSSWPSLPFAPASRPGKQRTPTTSPLTARRARPSSYFPIVGFPRLPCACALFSRPRLPRYQPRHRVASCCWHPPAIGRSSLLRHGLETGNIKGTIDAPRLPACLFPHPHVPGADQRAGSQNSRRENQPPGDTVCDRPTDPATQTPPYFGGPVRQPCG